jgi:1,4-dihydroxy-2-naphthoate octaprenyltransferase
MMPVRKSSLVLVPQVFVSVTHMLTHFFNEYYDLAADAAHESPSAWTGGPVTSFRLGCALTLLTALLLTLFPNTESKLLGVVIVVLAIGYSAPPLQLGNRGLGEADVMLVLNVLVPLLGYALFRSGDDSGSCPALLLAMVPPAVVEFVRMMVMNMADVVGDTRARKLTLVVRLGLDRSARVHALGMSLAYLALAALFLLGSVQWPVLLLELATLPLGATICWRLYHRRDYLSLIKFYNLPFLSTQHNGLILIAAAMGLVRSPTIKTISKTSKLTL